MSMRLDMRQRDGCPAIPGWAANPYCQPRTPLLEVSHAPCAILVLRRPAGPDACAAHRRYAGVGAKLADAASQVHPDAWAGKWRRHQRSAAAGPADKEMGPADRDREPPWR